MSGYKVTDWHGLYGDGWKGEITPAAFAHPAKFSRALIRHIYDHCAAEGWLTAGDTVCDPFGGVALGGLDALRLGLHWVGCELEPRFVDLGQQNIALWNSRYAGRFRTWGSAELLQGDSRDLAAVLGAARVAVSSPPYATSDQNYRAGWARFHAGHAPLWRNDAQREAEYGEAVGQLADLPATEAGFAAAVGSPPFQESLDRGNVGAAERREVARAAGISNAEHISPIDMERLGLRTQADYGSATGQLAAMPAGDLAAAISSPPFLQTRGGVNVTSTEGPLSDPALIERHKAGNAAANGYGDSAGQMAAMAEGEFEGVVSSPPWDAGAPPIAPERVRNSSDPRQHGAAGPQYLAMPEMENFWSAARAIVAQTYSVLTPGGHACWVVKNFVRAGKVVPFTDQWRQLCEAVGFVTLHEHRAWVVENHGTQMAHDGQHKAHVTSRKSFFRRLAEKKGSPEINWESVLCMVKPPIDSTMFARPDGRES